MHAPSGLKGGSARSHGPIIMYCLLRAAPSVFSYCFHRGLFNPRFGPSVTTYCFFVNFEVVPPKTLRARFTVVPLVGLAVVPGPAPPRTRFAVVPLLGLVLAGIAVVPLVGLAVVPLVGFTVVPLVGFTVVPMSVLMYVVCVLGVCGGGHRLGGTARAHL